MTSQMAFKIYNRKLRTRKLNPILEWGYMLKFLFNILFFLHLHRKKTAVIRNRQLHLRELILISSGGAAAAALIAPAGKVVHRRETPPSSRGQ
jgi:hypothetical protein